VNHGHPKRCGIGFGVIAVILSAAAPTGAQPAALAVSAAAQTNAGADFRTSWGDPDLQGIWTTETVTPFERPVEFAGREFLTAEEAAEFEVRVVEGRSTEGPLAPNNPGTYNDFWFDRGTRVVQDRRTSLIVDPPNGRLPWKAGAEDRIGGTLFAGPYYSWADLDTGERCLTDGPTLVPMQGYNMNFQILQTPGHVAILHEMFGNRHLIPLDERPHVGPNIRQWLGDSRGHWDGDTLVVETVNYVDKTEYRWARGWRASRPAMRLVERFKRIDKDTIDYRFTVEDSSMFTSAWTAVVPMSQDRADRGVADTDRLYEYACHEGNYAIVNVLSGARQEELVAK